MSKNRILLSLVTILCALILPSRSCGVCLGENVSGKRIASTITNGLY